MQSEVASPEQIEYIWDLAREISPHADTLHSLSRLSGVGISTVYRLVRGKPVRWITIERVLNGLNGDRRRYNSFREREAMTDGVLNTSVKATPEQVNYILGLATPRGCESLQSIATESGVGRTTIARIMNGHQVQITTVQRVVSAFGGNWSEFAALGDADAGMAAQMAEMNVRINRLEQRVAELTAVVGRLQRAVGFTRPGGPIRPGAPRQRPVGRA